MAITPLSSILFPLSKPHHPLNEAHFPFHSSSTRPSWFRALDRHAWRTQRQPRRTILGTRKHSLSSIATDLQNDKENEGAEAAEMSTQPATELAENWREIHGGGNWAGLLDPMNPLLRSELIRYWEMAQACYDAFDYDPFSKYCGSCRFSRRNFFQRLGMEDEGYEVTRFLYATANINMPNFFTKPRWPKLWSKHANWIGYVAVSNDETSRRLGRRDIAISWRGTVTRLEWVADLMDYLNPISSDKIRCPDPAVKVESGFLDLYTDKEERCGFCKYSAREQILSETKRLTEKYAGEEVSITITGHSLGSALAVISAYDIAETGLNKTADGRVVPVSVFSFSGPRVGNVRFKERLHRLGVKVLRIVNVHDVVPKSPGLFFNENLPPLLLKMLEWLPWTYSHVGVELKLDHLDSPYLRPSIDPTCSHNLEAHLHLLDGYHGKGLKFELATGRDHALVNKACDFLDDKYLIPPMWRQDENKGMIYDDGRWVQLDRSKIDGHPQDTHHHLKQMGRV